MSYEKYLEEIRTANLEAFKKELYGNFTPKEPNCQEEFDIIRRRGPKLSMAQVKRMQHLENHLDAGDVICNCYKEEQ